MTIRTEFAFTLPRGLPGSDGDVHREGIMRLATARDEIEPLRDGRVRENEAYATVIVLSRVVTELGTVQHVTTKTIESLFVSDFGYLQDLYRIVNFQDASVLEAVEPGTPFPQGSLAGA